MISRTKFFEQFLDGTTGRLELRRMKWRPQKSAYQMLERFFTRSITELEDFASNGAGDVFHGVNLRDNSGAARKENIMEIVGAAMDIDFKKTPQAEVDGLLAVSIFEPTILVSSGGGYHGYMFFDAPLTATEENINIVEGISKGLARHFGGDYTHDVTRIL